VNIGIMGGTFDPIHNGHLAMAEAVNSELGLAEVRFVPAGQPWLKVDSLVSPAEHRVQMVRLAIAGKPGFSLSTIEIDRPGAGAVPAGYSVPPGGCPQAGLSSS